MNVLKSLLFAAFEESNLLPFLAISVFLTAMVLLFAKAAIILRLQGDDTIRQSTLSANHNNLQATRLKMTRVHIPFTFRLLEIGNNSYEEVRLAVSSQIKYKLQAFWAVSIRELHMSLWRPWTELKEASKAPNGTIVEASNCQHLAADMNNQQPHTEHVITLRSPQKPLVLGAPPRLAYPLVVFLIRDTENDENLHPDETVVLVNVIHLRDPVCPLPTSVLAQYLKQSSGQLSCLKQLYLATGDPFSADENSTTTQSLSLAEPVACSNSNEPLLCSDTLDTKPQAEQLCVVCHYFPLSRALLPCRHTCICAVCFSKLDRCPMCRAPITSFFCIRTEDYLPPNALDTKANKPKSSTIHWLDSLNDRLTDFLGFR